jgi:hypothetical protein
LNSEKHKIDAPGTYTNISIAQLPRARNSTIVSSTQPPAPETHTQTPHTQHTTQPTQHTHIYSIQQLLRHRQLRTTPHTHTHNNTNITTIKTNNNTIQRYNNIINKTKQNTIQKRKQSKFQHSTINSAYEGAH